MDFEGLIDVVDLLAVEGALDEAQHVARARVGLLVRNAVPALDDRCARGAQSHREPTVGHFGQRRDAHRQQSRATGEDRRHRDTEVQPRLPRGGEDQGSEPVGPVDFGGPDVAVTQVSEAVE